MNFNINCWMNKAIDFIHLNFLINLKLFTINKVIKIINFTHQFIYRPVQFLVVKNPLKMVPKKNLILNYFLSFHFTKSEQ